MIRCALGLLATTALAATSAAAAEVQIAAQGPVVELTGRESVEAVPDIDIDGNVDIADLTEDR